VERDSLVAPTITWMARLIGTRVRGGSLRVVCILAAILVCLAGTDAAASGSTVLSPRVVGSIPDVSSTFPVFGDDRDLLVWQYPPDRLVFYDSRWHARSFVMAPQLHCFDGQVTAVGYGQVLVQCPRLRGTPPPPLRFVLIDARSGAATSFATPTSHQASPTYKRIGRYWLQGFLSPNQGGETVYYNWRTHAFVEGSRDHNGAHRFADPSIPTLWRGLCAPFQRPRISALNPGLHDLYEESFQSEGDWIAYPGSTSGIFGRCGRPYRRLGAVGEVELGGGLLSWLEGTWVHVLRLRDGKQYIAASASNYLARTSHDLIFGQRANGTWTILAAPIPNR
jgi:hypothetical protein